MTKEAEQVKLLCVELQKHKSATQRKMIEVMKLTS